MSSQALPVNPEAGLLLIPNNEVGPSVYVQGNTHDQQDCISESVDIIIFSWCICFLHSWIERKTFTCVTIDSNNRLFMSDKYKW